MCCGRCVGGGDGSLNRHLRQPLITQPCLHLSRRKHMSITACSSTALQHHLHHSWHNLLQGIRHATLRQELGNEVALAELLCQLLGLCRGQ